MVTTVPDSMLGIGIYTPSEAGMYARLRTRTISRWIFGDAKAEAVIDARLGNEPSKIVTFLDFVQMLAIREIRREKKVPLGKIRDAVATARDKYSIEYPFAMHHKTFLLGSEIVIEIRQEKDLVQLTGRNKRQLVLREVAELYMENLTFGEDGLAKSFKAYEVRGREVVMNPSRRLGKPFLPSCGYTADSLLHAYETEGSIAAASEAFGVDPKDVELAVGYFDYLQGSDAA